MESISLTSHVIFIDCQKKLPEDKVRVNSSDFSMTIKYRTMNHFNTFMNHTTNHFNAFPSLSEDLSMPSSQQGPKESNSMEPLNKEADMATSRKSSLLNF